MGTTSRVDQVPPLHGGTSLADRLENAVNTNQERIMNMIFTNRKENNIVIEVKNGVSSDGSLTGRFYTANIEGWCGEGLTEADAIRDVHQTRAEALIKLNHGNRSFGTRLTFEVAS